MRKLETVQTKELLNSVFAVDEVGPGGVYHEYAIHANSQEEDARLMGVIKFQKGPRYSESSQHGVIDSDLLEIVKDRMIAFQNGPFASEYNAEALRGINIALNALNKRVEDRIARNVLGKNEK